MPVPLFATTFLTVAALLKKKGVKNSGSGTCYCKINADGTFIITESSSQPYL
jgi:hypothetical protein